MKRLSKQGCKYHKAVLEIVRKMQKTEKDSKKRKSRPKPNLKRVSGRHVSRRMNPEIQTLRSDGHTHPLMRGLTSAVRSKI
jgi:hypothetical protein